MRWASLIAAAATIGGMGGVLAITGCAAVFRSSKAMVRVESDPQGGNVTAKDVSGAAPLDIAVPRSGITELRVTMPGFEEHHALVRKRANGLWVTADVATC